MAKYLINVVQAVMSKLLFERNYLPLSLLQEKV